MHSLTGSICLSVLNLVSMPQQHEHFFSSEKHQELNNQLSELEMSSDSFLAVNDRMENSHTSNSNQIASIQRGTPFDGGKQPGITTYGNIDFLLWWSKDAPLSVPLVTSGNASDPLPGALGQPGTKVRYGNHDIDFDAQPGARVALRTWFGDRKTFGIEASGLFLPKQSHTFSISSKEVGGVIAVPFFCVETPILNSGWQSVSNLDETAVIIGGYENNPTVGFFTGDISVKSSTELWDCELNALFNFFRKHDIHCSALAGLLYVDLRDTLHLRTFTIANSISNSNSFFLPTKITDEFETHNQFYGIQLGAEGEWSDNWFYIRAIGKVGLGAIRQGIDIQGSFSDPEPIVYNNYGAASGGIFAQQSNIGDRHKTRFAVVPEAFLQFGVNATKNLRIAVGYNFMYINTVVRPGDQIDRSINTTEVGQLNATPTGPARPKPHHHTTGYWAQGLNVGIEFRY